MSTTSVRTDLKNFGMNNSGPECVSDGVVWEQLREDQPVTFDPGQGDKGPRAENVRLG